MVNINKEEIETNTTEEQTLISKKELLALTKISYGQLYRWKRMNIIPESWFIKKAMPTGQETFFRRDQILERIDMILAMKDDVSLEKIADMINNKGEEHVLDIQEVLGKDAVSSATVEVYGTLYNLQKPVGHKELVALAVIEKYLLNSVITLDEVKLLIGILNQAFDKLYDKEGKILLYRKFGIAFIVAITNQEEIIIDEKAVKIIEVDLIKEVTYMSKKLT